MAQLPLIATIATVGATVVGAGAQIYNGYQQKLAADQTALNMEAQGKNEFAAAQRDAQTKILQGNLIMSSQQAMAAASGGGAGSDAPTITRLMTETAKRAEFASENSISTGDLRKAQFDNAAAADRVGGNDSLLGGFLSGIGTIGDGIGSYAKLRQQGLVM